MPTFSYKALDASGGISTGTLEQVERQQAITKLESQGLKPLELLESQAPTSQETPFLNFSKKMSSRQLEELTRLLSNLLTSGLSLSRALDVLCRECDHPGSKEAWEKVRTKVIDGSSLADAMTQEGNSFPRVYIAMVRAGEAGGFLDLVLKQIAEFQSRERDLKSKMTAALVYPAVLIFIAFAVTVFLLVFFIPRFQTMFDDLNAELPLITNLVISLSHGLRQYGLIFLLLGLGILYFTRQQWVSPAGRRYREILLMKLPVMGRLIAKYAMARFTRMLGTLLASDVALIQSLKVASHSLGMQILSDTIAESIERVQKGESLGKGLSHCRVLFSGSTLEMISISEESNRLDSELVRIAEDTEADLDRKLKTSVALIEPLVLFLISVLVGLIFIAMVLPIFTIQEYIK